MGNQGLIPYCPLRKSVEYTSELTYLEVGNLIHLYTNCCPFCPWGCNFPHFGIVPVLGCVPSTALEKTEQRTTGMMVSDPGTWMCPLQLCWNLHYDTRKEQELCHPANLCLNLGSTSYITLSKLLNLCKSSCCFLSSSTGIIIQRVLGKVPDQ